jgi:hypothetical protein
LAWVTPIAADSGRVISGRVLAGRELSPTESGT